jgi:glycerol-3-phosphate dehydrogenase
VAKSIGQITFDLAIIGGGINGCGIARDAAGRGLSVFLCEKGDLGSGTSSASTKLIHGGLRYLEYYQFRLVREALAEREVLLHAAPHIIWPLRFVLPHTSGLRPAWLIRLGLFVYDHLGGRQSLPGTRRIDLTRDAAGRPLKPHLRSAFEYSDCWVEDSRLVVLNAMDAAAHGATVRTRAELVSGTSADGAWRLEIADHNRGSREQVRARVLVNAAGPWVGQLLQRLQRTSKAPVRLVKGSHIIVSKLFEHERAYILQNDDGRIVFAIPYERDFTLIGTTDLDYVGDPAGVAITASEVDYLCAAINRYFSRQISPGDVVGSYAGVRPLYDDGASEAKAATRDYVLDLDEGPGQAPLLNVYGGKITTYRRLAEEAMARLASRFATMSGPWTRHVPLPGGNFPVGGFEAQVERLRAACPVIEAAHARRLVRAYGTRARLIVEACGERGRLGRAVRGRSHRTGIAISDRPRMGPDGRRRDLAALKAGAAPERQRGRAPARLDGHRGPTRPPPRNRSGRPRRCRRWMHLDAAQSLR